MVSQDCSVEYLKGCFLRFRGQKGEGKDMKGVLESLSLRDIETIPFPCAVSRGQLHIAVQILFHDFFVYQTHVVIFLEEQGKCGLLQLRFCSENCCVEDGFSAVLVCVVGMEILAIIVLEVRFLPVQLARQVIGCHNVP